MTIIYQRQHQVISITSLTISTNHQRPMSHAMPEKRQRTLDAILTRTPPSITGEPPAKRRRFSIDTTIDVDSYRSEDGQVSTRGRKEVNRHLLKTLGKDENPITNSDLYDRYVTSSSFSLYLLLQRQR